MWFSAAAKGERGLRPQGFLPPIELDSRGKPSASEDIRGGEVRRLLVCCRLTRKDTHADFSLLSFSQWSR